MPVLPYQVRGRDALTGAANDARSVLDPGAKEDIMLALSNENCRKILRCLSGEAKPASAISRDCGIPASTVYRQLDFLMRRNLLDVSGDIENGKKLFMYKSRVHSIQGIYADNELTVRIAFYKGDRDRYRV